MINEYSENLHNNQSADVNDQASDRTGTFGVTSTVISVTNGRPFSGAKKATKLSFHVMSRHHSEIHIHSELVSHHHLHVLALFHLHQLGPGQSPDGGSAVSASQEEKRIHDLLLHPIAHHSHAHSTGLDDQADTQDKHENQLELVQRERISWQSKRIVRRLLTERRILAEKLGFFDFDVQSSTSGITLKTILLCQALIT